MMRLVFATGRLLALFMWNRRRLMSARDMETMSDATQHVVKEVAEASYSQIIERYLNTTIQHNNIWSIPFEAHTKDILKEVQ